MSEWPWSDLVSLVHRHAKPENGYRRVLELGCGAGANIPFLQSLGMDYCAVEGSSFIVARLRARFPEIAANIVVGDFTRKIPFTSRFDLVIDRASVTHHDGHTPRLGIGC
ncbi:MAG: class I SAM-dependent methyltransferase [Xanthobacteraceae bacterium]